MRLKLVPGFAGLFAGSDGSIWRYRNYTGRAARWNGWRQLKLQTHRDGYLEVVLPRKERSNRHVYVHTLVARAFLGERPVGRVVRHLDGNKLNCRVANLAYGTQRENSDDMAAHGTRVRGERSHLAKLTDEHALLILAGLRAGETRKSLATQFGVGIGTIDSIRSGRTWSHLSHPSFH